MPIGNASRRSDVPRQRFMTNPSGLRHSSRQRSRSGLNCHRPAASSVAAMISCGMLREPREGLDRGVDDPIRGPGGEAERQPTR